MMVLGNPHRGVAVIGKAEHHYRQIHLGYGQHFLDIQHQAAIASATDDLAFWLIIAGGKVGPDRRRKAPSHWRNPAGMNQSLTLLQLQRLHQRDEAETNVGHHNGVVIHILRELIGEMIGVDRVAAAAAVGRGVVTRQLSGAQPAWITQSRTQHVEKLLGIRHNGEIGGNR